MNRKLVLIMSLTLLTGMLSVSFNVQNAKASGTIYIRADGSIDPPTAPISTVDNVTYILAGNITSEAGGIVVERSNIVVDGNGHTLEGRRAYDSKGIYLSGNGNVTIRNSKVKGFYYGFRLDYSSNNTISKNDIENNEYGMQLYGALNNEVYDNDMVNNTIAMWLGYSSNTLISKSNIEVTTSNLGGVYLGGSSNNTIAGNRIVGSPNFGIRFAASSNDNVILENNITNNNWGIELLESSARSKISGNRIEDNEIGVRVQSDSSNNAFCHNSIIGNSQQVYDYAWEYPDVSPSTNVWDDGYPSGGNYWSNYTGVDLDHDGIGDSAHVIDTNNTDHYPLMGMFSDFNATSELHVQPISNSTITDFRFDGAAIRFNVTGEEGTAGFCRICVPKELMAEPYHVFVNGTEIQHTLLLCSNGTHSYLYFSYTHSTEEVTIIPELPVFFILPSFMMATLLAVIVYTRKNKDE